MSRCYECAEIDGFCTCQRDEALRVIAERDAAIARAEAAEAAIAAVRALHEREPGQRKVGHGDNAEGIWFCAGCLDEYPCATIRALDAGATT